MTHINWRDGIVLSEANFHDMVRERFQTMTAAEVRAQFECEPFPEDPEIYVAVDGSRWKICERTGDFKRCKD